MSDTRLQELYIQALARRGSRASACVTPDDILALVSRKGSEARRLETLDHVMGCAACHREFELLRAIKAADPEVAQRRAGVKSVGQRFLPLALAASVLLAVGVGLAVWERSGAGDTTRGGGSSLQLLSPATEVSPGQPLTFVWQPLSGAARYRIEVLDQSDSVLFSQLTPDTTATWSGKPLRPGSRYRWWVRDETPGAQRASSFRPLRIRSQ
jgi:hypothetical protein